MPPGGERGGAPSYYTALSAKKEVDAVFAVQQDIGSARSGSVWLRYGSGRLHDDFSSWQTFFFFLGVCVVDESQTGHYELDESFGR